MQFILAQTLLLLALAASVHSSPVPVPERLSARAPTYVPLAQTASAAYCQSAGTGTSSTQPSLSCPAGRVLQVQRLFLGRDEPATSGATCPGPAPVYNCSLSAADGAAATLWAAALCDGQSSCVPPAASDLAAAFGNPCPPTTELTVRIDYACRDSSLDAPTPPAPLPADTLRRIRPGTTVAQKCPKYGAAYAAVLNAAWTTNQRFAPVKTTFGSVSVFGADLKSTDLDALVRSVTNNAFSLDTVAELNVTAFNLDLGNTTVVVGRNNTGYTKLSISAFNIISDGGAIDVHSQGPDASGRFGPDVVVRAVRTFGPIKLMQNGLPAAPKPITSGSFNNTGILSDQGPPNLYAGFPPDEWQCSPDPTAFRPICYPPGGTTTCVGSPFESFTQCTAPFQFSDIFGNSILNPPQADGSNGIQMQTDRFLIPEFNTSFAHVANTPIQGKSKLYGSIKSSGRAFYSRDGLSSSATASYEGLGIGILGTADYAITLLRNPAAQPWIENYNENHFPAGLNWQTFLGLFWLMGGPNSPLAANAPMYLGCGANENCYFLRVSEYSTFNTNSPDSPFYDTNSWSISGNLSYNPATASSAAPVDSILSRFAAGCADEMISAGRFSDAQAFLVDTLPSLAPSSDAATGRAFAALGALRTARKQIPSHPVPLLSATTLEQAVGLELQSMVWLEANASALANQGTTAGQAVAILQASNATIGAVAQAAQIELQGDIKNVVLYQNALSSINQTYQDRYADLASAQSTFEDGVKKAESAEIAELVVEFILDVATTVATEGAAGATIMDTVEKAGGTMAKVFANLEKFAAVLAQIGSMIYNVDSLVNQLIPIVNQIESLPSAPTITIPDSAVMAASGSNDTIAALTTALLSYQDLRDQATVYLGPAITQGIDGASDYALALSGLANAGIDLVGIESQLVTAQLKMVLTAAKLQAAQEAQATITGLVQAAQGSAGAIAAAATEVQLDLVDRKVRTLDLVYQVEQAYGFARTATFAQAQSLPDPSSPAGDFVSAVQTATYALDHQVDLAQPICNASWIVYDPVFISNISSTGIGFLDFRDPSQATLLNFFSGLDDVHMLQINLKPFGIQFNGTAIPGITPVLQLDISPTGEYRNTFTGPTGTRYVEDFLAVPWRFAMQVQPTNNWQVIVPGSLTGNAAQKYYVPSVYGRWRVAGDPNMVASWNWTGVWGVGVEIYGFATLPNSAQAATGGLQRLRACSGLSQDAIDLVAPNGVGETLLGAKPLPGAKPPNNNTTTTTTKPSAAGRGVPRVSLAISAFAGAMAAALAMAA